MTASLCLSQQPDREKVDLVCVLFPSYSHSPCFGFNWLFPCLLFLSPPLSLSALCLYLHPFLFSLRASVSPCFSYCLLSCLSPNYFCQSVRLTFCLLPPAEALRMCQVLAWVACFHMEVFRRWYRTYVTRARWLGTLWRSHRVISGSENASTAVQGRRKEDKDRYN